MTTHRRRRHSNGFCLHRKFRFCNFSIMDGFGYINFWGFSPALDLQQTLTEINDKFEQNGDQVRDETDVFNALIMGSGDGRHLLKTISQINRHSRKKVNLYVIESSLETLARQILFLKLIFEPLNRLGMQERVEMFLELMGNVVVRPNTWRYVEKTAKELIEMITNLDYQTEKLPFLNLSNLKFKERDALESIFKLWKEDKKIDIESYWDKRLRQNLQLRYDSRDGAFDWDYNMKLIDRGGGIISSTEYKKWRRSGVAFEFRDADYTAANKTLLSGVIVNQGGDRLVQKGFWGDVVLGPFVGYGIQCEDESFYEKRNKCYVKKSKDISFRNILAYLYELSTQQKFQSVDKTHSTTFNVTQNTALDVSQYVSVVILPCKSVDVLHNKSAFTNFFHLIFCSNSMSHHFTSNLSKTFKPNAVILLETAKFLLDLKDEHAQKFQEQLDIKAKDCKCNPCQTDTIEAVSVYTYQN